MTALMDRDLLAPDAARLDRMRETLDELRELVRAQGRVIEVLDHRREALEELVDDMLPVANAAALIAIRKLDAIDRAGLVARVTDEAHRLDAVRRAPAPTLRALWRRLRAPDARQGMALALEALAATARLAESGTGGPAAAAEPLRTSSGR